MSGIDDSYSKSLLHMDGADTSVVFTDESGKTWTPYSTAQIDTAQSKFSGASGLFGGAGIYIDTPDHADFDVGSGDFTIDTWIRPSAIDQDCYICAQCADTGANATISWFIRLLTNETVYAGIYSGGTIYPVASATDIYAANTWLHIALIRYGNLLSVYTGGTAGATTANVTGVTANNSAYKAAIGRLGEYNGYYYAGHVDEFRFSKGIARWTANFTPPTAPYGVGSAGNVPRGRNRYASNADIRLG